MDANDRIEQELRVWIFNETQGRATLDTFMADVRERMSRTKRATSKELWPGERTDLIAALVAAKRGEGVITDEQQALEACRFYRTCSLDLLRSFGREALGIE